MYSKITAYKDVLVVDDYEQLVTSYTEMVIGKGLTADGVSTQAQFDAIVSKYGCIVLDGSLWGITPERKRPNVMGQDLLPIIKDKQISNIIFLNSSDMSYNDDMYKVAKKLGFVTFTGFKCHDEVGKDIYDILDDIIKAVKI